MSKYKCISCKSKIDPLISECPNCGALQPAEERAPYVRKKFGIGNIHIENITCKKCECDTAFVMRCDDRDILICTECGKGDVRLKEIYNPYKPTPKPKVTCPYCQSTNTKKISTASKVGSVAMWGIFALGKTTKQWHCNNCKSDF